MIQMSSKIIKVLSNIFLAVGLFIMSASATYIICGIIDKKETEKTMSSVKDLIIDDAIIEEEPTQLAENIDNATDKSTTVAEDKPKKILNHKYDKVYEQNSDFVGWIYVPGTTIDYPVMQTINNEQYYLHKNFYKYYDFAGVPFCSAKSDIKTPSDNILIYGHNMKDGSMFTPLLNYKDKSFYDDHKNFSFETIYRNGTYEVIGAVLTDINNGSYRYYNVGTCNENEFNEYLEYIKLNSLYKTDAIDNVKYGDKLVTLSTCAYHTNNGRFILVGKLIQSETKE